MKPRRQAASETLLARLDARYRGPLMTFFLRRVRSRPEAEDLTQETFLRLIRSDEATHLVNADAFVFQVAINQLRDRNRRHTVRVGAAGVGLSEASDPLSDAIRGTPHPLIEEITPERVLLGYESLEKALLVLGELNERTRDVFLLFRLENLKQREIAELFGISVSAVEKHVIRATVHLAKRLMP